MICTERYFGKPQQKLCPNYLIVEEDKWEQDVVSQHTYYSFSLSYSFVKAGLWSFRAELPKKQELLARSSGGFGQCMHMCFKGAGLVSSSSSPTYGEKYWILKTSVELSFKVECKYAVFFFSRDFKISIIFIRLCD